MLPIHEGKNISFAAAQCEPELVLARLCLCLNILNAMQGLLDATFLPVQRQDVVGWLAYVPGVEALAVCTARGC